MMKKLVRELKWLAASTAVVSLVVGSLYAVAVLSQHKVEHNMARLNADTIHSVEYTRWGE